MTRIYLLEGETIGDYTLTRLIGTGGMGAVYQGTHNGNGQQVAVKVISNAASEDPDYIRRFNREIQVTSQLKHTNIVPFYDSGSDRDINYAVMQLLTGGSLEQRMIYLLRNSKPLPKVEGVVKIIHQLAAALDYAHALGVIHRDVKPSNIMFDEQGTPYLVDFGIAKIAEATSQITGTGSTIGTPAYMSPEQWWGRGVSPASDQYALAGVAYLMLTGHPAFDAPNMMLMMRQHTESTPPPPHEFRPDLNPVLEAVFLRAFAKSPADRYPTCVTFAESLDAAALRGEYLTHDDVAATSPQFIITPAISPADKLLSAPLNDDEQLRNALRVLFAGVYGDDSTPLKRKVAHRTLTRADDEQVGDMLLQDLIRGGFAELVLHHTLGDVLDALLIRVQGGDVAGARELLRQTPLDGDALADLLGQDVRSIVSNSRIDINRRTDMPPSATDTLIFGETQGGVTDTVARVFRSEGDTREMGLAYLRDLKSDAVVPVLLDILADDSAAEADLLDAVALLADYQAEVALTALRRLAREHAAAAVRRAALRAQAAIAGSYAGVVAGVAADWIDQNPRLGEQVLAYFGDETDNDALLVAMMRRDEPEGKRIVAAAALGMSGDADYALPLARFLMTSNRDVGKARWRAMLRYERDNPTPRMTDTVGDKLRDMVRETTLQPPDADALKQMQQLMMAMVYFGNARAEEALRGVTSDRRVDKRIRGAAETALEKLRRRRGD